ncbi:hypothetical protein [Hydrogenophaga borbori]|uniref:hypothetical protein n=1 Tax=Hydrogenophaga borbori TaxID=2294117 RepID=UPI00301C6C91
MSGVWVVGTGLAGHTLARELRKLRPEVEITLVTRDAGDFYSKPALSNAVSAGLAPEQLVQRSAEQMAAQLQVRILQKATDVVFPCMPVVAKTPSFPVVVAPVVDGSPFRWEKAGEGSGHRAWCKDANDQVRGFALGGEAVGERFRWERSVAAWLAADAPISEAAPVQASNP